MESLQRFQESESEKGKSLNIHIRYLSYVIRHKIFVFQAGLHTGASLWRLLKHDWSKFLPSEWIPYANYFYAPEPIRRPLDRPNHELTIKQWKSALKKKFNTAWLYHIHSNDHHWQFWILKGDDGETVTLEMPEAARLEMIADWMGAGRAIAGKWEAGEWYRKNGIKMQLHPRTRSLVEAHLDLLHADGMA